MRSLSGIIKEDDVNKFWLIMKIIFLIGASMVMLYMGTIYMEAAVVAWFSWETVLGLAGTLWFYIWGYKGCRLAVEEIAKEMLK